MVRRRRIQDENGQTMVEFALVLPLLCVVLFGIVQFGILYNNYVTLTDATRAGARKAAVSRLAANPESVTRASVRA
jgi:Flp pilus assembly protein TadG